MMLGCNAVLKAGIRLERGHGLGMNISEALSPLAETVT